MLIESSWEGGAGYTPQQVGEMTPDQVMFRLCDKTLLRQRSGRRRDHVDPMQVSRWAGADGRVRGVAADGTSIRARIAGKSLAQQVMEAELAKKRAERRKKYGRS